MSDRYNYLTVFLEGDMKDEDAKGLIDAILRMRGVLAVTPNVRDPASVLAQERARREVIEKLWEVLKAP